MCNRSMCFNTFYLHWVNAITLCYLFLFPKTVRWYSFQHNPWDIVTFIMIVVDTKDCRELEYTTLSCRGKDIHKRLLLLHKLHVVNDIHTTSLRLLIDFYKHHLTLHSNAQNMHNNIHLNAGNNFPGIASQFAMHFLYDCYSRYLWCSSFPS